MYLLRKDKPADIEAGVCGENTAVFVHRFIVVAAAVSEIEAFRKIERGRAAVSR
jgi:hypothetical protein